MSEPNYDIAYFDIHVFCCTNQREAGHPRGSCSQKNAVDLQGYMKSRIKELEIGSVRINKSGCLDRCELGPVLVIYPEGAWYTYSSKQDIDDIIENHILSGERVSRLALSAEQQKPLDLDSKIIRLKVDKVIDETDLIRRIELVSNDDNPLPEFTAGAHVDIPTSSGQGKSYSLAGDPADTSRYTLGILKEVDGDGGSVWMHESVKEGMILKTSTPLNTFPLAEDAAEYILIAGGIGITPLLSMGYELRQKGAKFHLHYCTKSIAETAFVKEVKQVFGKQVTFYHDGGDPLRGIKLEDVIGKRPEGAYLYLCGPVGLMDAARGAAKEWPADTVQFEYFRNPEASLENENQPFDIFLTRRGEGLHVPADKTILDMLRLVGINHPSSCEEGCCGTCSTRMVSGKADHRDTVLNDQQKAANEKIMVCCSRAIEGETLLLDL